MRLLHNFNNKFVVIKCSFYNYLKFSNFGYCIFYLTKHLVQNVQNFFQRESLSNNFELPLYQKQLTEISQRQLSQPKLDRPKGNTLVYPEEHLQDRISKKKLVKQINKYKTKDYSPESHEPQNKKNHNLSELALQKDQIREKMSKMIRNRYINQFIQNLIQNSSILMDQKFTQTEAYLENDKCSKAINEWGSKSEYLLQPNQKFMVILDCYFVLISIVSLCFGPFLSSFQVNGYETLKIIILLSIILEIFVSINRAIIKQGNIIQDRIIILKSYLKVQFCYDFLLIISWIMYISKLEQISIANEVIFVISSLANIKKLNQNYQNQFDTFYLKKGMSNIVDLITLIILIIFYAHFMACIWHYIGNTYQDEVNWLEKYNLVDVTISKKYFYSFYWSTVTMTTIGYGDITPSNEAEVIFCSIMILLSSCVFAYLMNSIGIILKHINDSKFKYQIQMSLINQYMNTNDVNQNIQARVKNYLSYFMKNEERENQQQVDFLIQQLPENLRLEMTSEISNMMINRIQLLKQNFSKDLLIKLCKKLKQVQFSTGDIIFNQNDQKNTKLYFVLKGQVALIEKASKKIIETKCGNECFNEYSFFTELPPKVTAYCTDYTEALELEREAIIEALFGLQRDLEIFHKIKDSIIFQHQFDKLKLKCGFCGKYQHQSIDCHRIQYKPDLELTIKKILYKHQERKFKARGRNFNYHSLTSKNAVNAITKKYRELKNIITDQHEQNLEAFSNKTTIEQSCRYYVTPIQEQSDEGQFESGKQDSNDFVQMGYPNLPLKPLNNVVAQGTISENQEFIITKNNNYFSFIPNEQNQLKQLNPIIDVEQNQLKSPNLMNLNDFNQLSKSVKSRMSIQISMKYAEKQYMNSNIISDQISYQNIRNTSNQLLQNKKDKPKLIEKQLQFQRIIIDKCKNYQFYFPENNANKVINQCNYHNQAKRTKKKLDKLDIEEIEEERKLCKNYTFNFNSIKLIIEMKKKIKNGLIMKQF